IENFMLIKFSTSNPQSLRDSSLERELLTIAFTLENISTNRNLPPYHFYGRSKPLPYNVFKN
ncbi:MAG: hypothetical protein IKK49_05355, partial [Clostridia bacterium]|nr:hypothetical protein [Clostridia bacterium]